MSGCRSCGRSFRRTSTNWGSPTSARETATKTADRGRRGLSLETRIFLVSSLLIALLVGGAVAVTLLTLRGIARNAAIESLRGTAAAQTAFQEQRYRQLLLISRVFATDASISAYLSDAANLNSTRSILDLLGTAQSNLGFDFAIVLDPKGKVVARTDHPGEVGEDLSKRPLVAAAMASDNQESRGVWREGDRLYNAVAVPLAKDFTSFGSLITGFQINDQAEGVKELRDVSGADVAFVAAGPQGPKIAATTLSPETARSLSTMLK